MVEEANPPKPFVSSHSRRKAASKSPQTSCPRRIMTCSRYGPATSFSAHVLLGSLLGERNRCRGSAFYALGRFAALLQQFGDETGPTRLMAGSESRARVPVEVLVEKQQVTPVRVSPKSLHRAMRRPPALFVAQENSGQPP